MLGVATQEPTWALNSNTCTPPTTGAARAAAARELVPATHMYSGRWRAAFISLLEVGLYE